MVETKPLAIHNSAANALEFEHMEHVLDLALQEDLQSGDITSLATVDSKRKVTAKVVYKQAAIVAGLNVFCRVLQKIDPRLVITTFIADGQRVDTVPQTVAIVEGAARCVLAGERTALNFLQRLSGIATITGAYVQKAKAAGIAILDTRKTTPTLRAFEKQAVRAGGGSNHRFGLYDAILIKDNHLALCGGVSQAVSSSRQQFPDKAIEVEVDNLTQLQEALSAGVNTVLLDNMTPQQVTEAVKLVNGQCRIEVSGGINLNNIDSYLISGVDAISIGALTHSAPSIDISLDMEA